MWPQSLCGLTVVQNNNCVSTFKYITHFLRQVVKSTLLNLNIWCTSLPGATAETVASSIAPGDNCQEGSVGGTPGDNYQQEGSPGGTPESPLSPHAQPCTSPPLQMQVHHTNNGQPGVVIMRDITADYRISFKQEPSLESAEAMY